jgi:hypothetical protein
LNATNGATLNGRLYVRDFSHTIHDSNTGTLIGNFSAKNPPVFSGNRGFFLHEDAFVPLLEARDVNTNEILWNFAGDGFLQSAVLHSHSRYPQQNKARTKTVTRTRLS